MNKLLYTLLLLLPLRAVAQPDSIRREINYLTPIEQWIDTAMEGFDGARLIEWRHLNEKGTPTFDIRPTFYDSPFVKPHDWC